VSVEILGPCPDFEAGINPNDNSLVLRIRHGKRAILLTGDAELNQEQKLLAGRNPLRADLLKVGHHGSRTSTSPAFVNRVQPALATISSGMRNRFGHPHPVTLDTLRRAGVRTLRLDRLGAISWSTDGQRMWLRAFESHSGVP
jgi:competence protein ComEC